MDTLDSYETTEDQTNFGTDLAKSFAISAAASIGTVAGFVVVGAIIGQAQKVKKARAAKKDQQDN